MKTEIDTDFLVKHNLTANKFVILQLVQKKKFKDLTKLKSISPEEFIKDVKYLIEQKYVDGKPEVEGSYKVTTLYKETFIRGDYFNEFYSLFPTSVIRPDGLRDSLRTAKKQCSVRYNRVAKRKDVHENIMKCLQFEIKERERTDTLKYMKRMPNWLSSETWKEWEEKMKLSSIFSIEEQSYGTTVI